MTEQNQEGNPEPLLCKLIYCREPVKQPNKSGSLPINGFFHYGAGRTVNRKAEQQRAVLLKRVNKPQVMGLKVYLKK